MGLEFDTCALKELSKNTALSSLDLQQALASVDMKVHYYTIRKRLHKFTFYVSKFRFSRKHIGNDQDFLDYGSMHGLA